MQTEKQLHVAVYDKYEEYGVLAVPCDEREKPQSSPSKQLFDACRELCQRLAKRHDLRATGYSPQTVRVAVYAVTADENGQLQRVAYNTMPYCGIVLPPREMTNEEFVVAQRELLEQLPSEFRDFAWSYTLRCCPKRDVPSMPKSQLYPAQLDTLTDFVRFLGNCLASYTESLRLPALPPAKRTLTGDEFAMAADAILQPVPAAFRNVVMSAAWERHNDLYNGGRVLLDSPRYDLVLEYMLPVIDEVLHALPKYRAELRRASQPKPAKKKPVKRKA